MITRRPPVQRDKQVELVSNFARQTVSQTRSDRRGVGLRCDHALFSISQRGLLAIQDRE